MKNTLRDVMKIADRFGIEILSMEVNKHIKLVVTKDGKQGTIWVSKSPSDYYFLKNVEGDLKRAVK